MCIGKYTEEYLHEVVLKEPCKNLNGSTVLFTSKNEILMNVGNYPGGAEIFFIFIFFKWSSVL